MWAYERRKKKFGFLSCRLNKVKNKIFGIVSSSTILVRSLGHEKMVLFFWFQFH